MCDAFTAPPPHVEAQTYALPTAVAAMGVTLTAAGIPPKQVLLATDAGQLLALEKRLFDRSEEHTSELQSPVPISYAGFCLQKKKVQHPPRTQRSISAYL